MNWRRHELSFGHELRFAHGDGRTGACILGGNDMKRLLISAIISLVLNAAGFVVNLVSYHSGADSGRHLPLALHMHGGEVTVEFGFGLRAVHLYGMAQGQSTTHSLSFDPVSMIVCLLLGIGVAYLVLLVGGKVLKK